MSSIVSLAFALGACPNEREGSRATADHDATVSGAADSALVDFDGTASGPADAGTDATSASVDGVTAACDAFGCGCGGDDDCASGYCVPTADGHRCAATCTESCPDGWSCRVIDSGTDPVSICEPTTLHLCDPCSDDASCQYRGGERCIPAPVPDDGSFCTSPCGAGGTCPDGYRCAELPFGGTLETHCVPESGVCECSPVAAGQGLLTACQVANAFGACSGVRSCGPEGLSECDAAVPAAETCDGADDDCDGQTDEGTCDDGLACTLDSCEPDGGGCVHALAPDRCLIGGQCVAVGAPSPAGGCQVCDPAASTTAWSPAGGDTDGDGVPDACDACIDGDHDGVSDPGQPLGGCPGDACAAGADVDPASCCTVAFGCEGDDDHLVTSFSCVDPGGATDRHMAFYADFCCYDASDEQLYCTAYGDWSAGSGRDTDPANNPALAAVTQTVAASGGQVRHDTDWTLVANFFDQPGNFCQFTAEGWAVDDPAVTGDKASYPGAGYPVARWSYTVDPSGGGDVACGGTTGTGTPETCEPPVAGAPLHDVTLSLNADDGWQGWLNGASLGAEEGDWRVVETSTHQLAEGCHVLAVHARDLFQVVSGFQGRAQVDGVDKYLTGTHRPLWRMTATPPPAQFGVAWTDRAYDADTAAWFEPLTCTATNWYDTAPVSAMRDAGAPMVWWGTPACTGLGESWVRLEIHVP